MGNIPGAVFCATCGNRLSGSAQPAVAPSQPTVGQSLAPASQAVGSAVEWIKRGGDKAGDEYVAGRRFPGLQATAGLLKLLAAAVLIWGVLGVVSTVNTYHMEWNFNPLDLAGAAMIFALGAPIVVAVLLWALSGAILVLLDIEAGVRRMR
jgi:hypothetical protein